MKKLFIILTLIPFLLFGQWQHKSTYSEGDKWINVLTGREISIVNMADSISILEANKYESGDSPTFSGLTLEEYGVNNASFYVVSPGGYQSLLGGNSLNSNDEVGNPMYSISWGYSQVYSGNIQCSAMFGYKSYVKANYGLTVGEAPFQYTTHQYVLGGGMHENIGDAQYTETVSKKTTSNADTAIVIIGKLYAKINTNIARRTHGLTIDVVASNSDGSVAGYYKRRLLITGDNSSVCIIGAPQIIGTDISVGGIGGVIDFTIYYNTEMTMRIVGKAATDLRWTIVVSSTEVGF